MRAGSVASSELIVLVLGAHDGYVGRDGQLVDMEDLSRRAEFGESASRPNATE